MNWKKIVLLTFGTVIVIFLLVLLITSIMNLFKQSPSVTQPLPQVTPVIPNTTPIINPPKSTLLLPTSSFGGVDTNAATVEASTNEIQKIRSILPYSQGFTLSNGQTVEIIISPPDSSRPWVLPVFIGGIDYQAPEGTEQYIVSRNSFREAAQEVFRKLSSEGVNTPLIFINWSDQGSIQDRAERWLIN